MRYIMTTMQKRALTGAVISCVVLLATILLLALNDPATLFEQDFLELIYLGIILGGAAVYGIVMLVTRRSKDGEAVTYDERDRFITRRALAIQLQVVLIAVALWCVVLVRIYIGAGGIPVPLMYVMYISILFLNFLARSISIYFGLKVPLDDLEKGGV